MAKLLTHTPIDPELQLFSGRQFSTDNNFRIFLGSCPDRWGRLLMKRCEAVLAKQEQRQARHLNEIDYLLGVHDQYRVVVSICDYLILS